MAWREGAVDERAVLARIGAPSGPSSGPSSGEAADDETRLDEARLWGAFASAAVASDFCRAWLAIQCQTVGGVAAGLLLLEQEGTSYAPAAIWPDAARDITHLGAAAESALQKRRGVIARNGAAAHVAYPVDIRGRLWGVIVLDLKGRPDAELQAVLRQLHWGAGWLETLFRRKTAEDDAARLSRTSLALEMVAVASEHKALQASALAVATELASRLSCSRVTMGLARKGAVRLLAMSHSASFQARTELAGAFENAMEEALDQQLSIAFPAVTQERRISVAHRDLARLTGNASALSVVMSNGGKPVGVLTFERTEKPFDAATAELCEAVAVLLGPVVALKVDARRWFAGRVIDGLGAAFRAVFGPRRPAAKFAALLAVALVAACVFVEGPFRISAKSLIEGAVQRAAVAPFEGYIATAPVRAGDIVAEGQMLAALDDKDLELERLRLRAEHQQQLLKYRDAIAKHDRASARVLGALVNQAEAQIALVEEKLSRTKIVAPFGGVVVSGDLSQMLGSPVEKGKVLFEIAPLDSYRVILQVDERDVSWIAEGQRGQLVLTGLAKDPFAFTVRKITPVATAAEGRNHFRVEAGLDQPDARLRPGMEGIGKVEIGEANLFWAWTRSLVAWAQLTIWKHLP